MKTLMIGIVFSCFLNLPAFLQNGDDYWNVEEISSITVEINVEGEKFQTKTYDTRFEIERIITFLKEIDLKEFHATSNTKTDASDTWSYRLSFQGHRDQVYLYHTHALIGKSIWAVKPNVIQEFEKLLLELKNQ